MFVGSGIKRLKFKIREHFWYKLLPYLLVNPIIKISLLMVSGCIVSESCHLNILCVFGVNDLEETTLSTGMHRIGSTYRSTIYRAFFIIYRALFTIYRVISI